MERKMEEHLFKYGERILLTLIRIQDEALEQDQFKPYL